MEPKYNSVAAIISFDGYPEDDALMIAVQDAWYDLCEEFDFLDPESGSLSIPIETIDGEIIFVYTMRALYNADIVLHNEEELEEELEDE